MLNPFRYNQASLVDWPRYLMTDPFIQLPHPVSLEAQMPDLKETDTAYQVHVAAAGIKPEDIQVTLDRGILRIKGESKGSKDGVEWHRRVEKSVQLPEMAIDADKVEATNEHGMLHVMVPKLRTQQPTPRSIPVTVKGQK